MMLPAQIGDVTDEVEQGEGCQSTATVILEQITYITYWVQGIASWMV